jgi:hypothetical protein
MPQEEGFEIYGRFYPSPQRFLLGDPVLVTQVTELTWPEFAKGLEEQGEEYRSLVEQGREDEFEPDQVLLLGLLAVAFWHGNKQMSRRRVAEAVERMPIEEIKFIAGDEEVDADPPAATGVDGSPLSMTTSASAVSPEVRERTEIPPDSTSDETSPNGSGSPGLPSQHPESLPA